MLFLYARDRCDGRETVKEIGDFVAHHSERTKGILTREVTDWFLTASMIAQSSLKPLQSTNLPANFREFLQASLRRAGLDIKHRGISAPEARRRLPEVLKKFVVNPDGSLAISPQHTSTEIELINLLTSVTVRPAFTADRLFDDFASAMQSNSLFTKAQRPLFKRVKPFVALFSATVMHNCTLQLGNDVRCTLHVQIDPADGLIKVAAPVPATIRDNVFISSYIFSTDLPDVDWCDEDLLQVQEKWLFALEVSPNGKLSKIG